MARALVCWLLVACARPAEESDVRPPGPVRLVFKAQPLWGDPAPFHALLAAFERENPGVTVDAEPLPNDSDLVHQYFLTALEGGARDFDVFIADVVWVPELARAGWVADLSDAFPPDDLRRDLLPGAADAVIIDGRTVAMPWYVDVGILYWRTDLVPRAPRTYDELVAMATDARVKDPTLAGYLWQGRQGEGLVCNVYESIWGHGGTTLSDGRVLLDTPEAEAGLGYLRSLVTSGVSPPSVTSATEEDTRRAFQTGGAVFMRNWPYAFGELAKEGSPVRGKVAIAPLPTVTGEPGWGALGGFQLAVNAHVPAWRRELAERLVAFLTSDEANVTMALAYARLPPRRAPYDDPRLRAGAPFIADLLPMVERARPRPVTPYYLMISDTLQGEFSAAVTGIRSPAEALRRAQRVVDHVTGR